MVLEGVAFWYTDMLVNKSSLYWSTIATSQTKISWIRVVTRMKMVRTMTMKVDTSDRKHLNVNLKREQRHIHFGVWLGLARSRNKILGY